ncbi:DUF4935 domain-containing protein [bacterium]|nr:DUF4935 domain-containing protein [bacterium]
MIVVLDTTETYQDFRLNNANFELLRTYLYRTSSTLVVPRIVFEETINHYRNELKKAASECKRGIKKIQKMTDGSIRPVNIDLEETVQEYRTYLEEQVCQLRGEIVDYNGIDVSSIVARALARRKPFDSNGQKGFRDAVLWESVLSLLCRENENSTDIALISHNSSDFGSDEVLASDLMHDCEAAGKSSDCVRLFHGLASFITKEVKPHLEKLESIRSQIENEQYEVFDLTDFFIDIFDIIRDAVSDMVRTCDFDSLTHNIFGDFREPELHELDNQFSSSSIFDVWSLQDNRIAASIEYAVPGKIKCLEIDEEPYFAGDKLFREHTENEFIGDATFTIYMTTILEIDTREVVDFEVDELTIDLGFNWPYRDND